MLLVGLGSYNFEEFEYKPLFNEIKAVFYIEDISVPLLLLQNRILWSLTCYFNKFEFNERSDIRSLCFYVMHSNYKIVSTNFILVKNKCNIYSKSVFRD